MAKWGEGDPRWIVEERADATNVNNWHWSEKDATGWSKEKLKTLFAEIAFEDDAGKFAIVEVTKLEGEATANNRKAKLILFYEWSVTLKWKATPVDDDKSVEGELEVNNLSDENTAEDIDIVVSVKTGSPRAEGMRDIMRKKGVLAIRKAVAGYIRDLRDEYAKGLILPTPKQQQQQSTQATAAAAKTPASASSAPSKAATAAAAKGSVLPASATKTISQRHEFKTSAAELYDVLVNVSKIQAFTQSPCQLEATPGGFFSYYNGNVLGNFVELVPEKKLVQQWRFSNWPHGHFSLVTIELEQKDDHTDLVLTQTAVPEAEYERTNEGWVEHFWQKIMGVFGFGSSLF